ncbi:PTS system maltose-specific EIICB component [bioreactor metagenome]|uniref:PTS system maltose-specific EIICB component n=1 Tax=bioreactor metagenome TaxID=1076179 RepID=A0A645B6T8_9ZZZZ
MVYAVSLSFSLVNEDKEWGAFSGLMGYLAFLISMGILVNTFPAIFAMFPTNGITTVLGISTVNCGILGGILVGCLVPVIHKKFREVKLPMTFAFFQGVRFVPFMSIIIMTVIGQVFPFIWVYISQAINALASVINTMGAFGPFLYGTVEKLLIPTGLHQIWNAIVRDTAASGIFTFASGTVIEGSRPAFFQYLVEGLPKEAGLVELVKFLRAGQMPFTIFVAPAVALAIYKCADPDKRELIKPLVITGALTAMFAGITEPLEFIFLFTAPLLFVLYAIIGGMNWMILYLLGNTMGGTSAHILGLLIYGVLRTDANWWYTVMLGIVEAPLMYLLFKWWIIRFNVKTPGRGGDYDESLAFAQEIANTQPAAGKKETTDPEILKARMIIESLGGKENIILVDSCMSRLRVEYKDNNKIDEQLIKRTGCQGIVRIDDNNIQIVYGVSVGLIAKSVNKELK